MHKKKEKYQNLSKNRLEKDIRILLKKKKKKVISII